MNKKNKVLLTSVGLALLSGIAATGSTFAWFTTTRTATISYTKATVTSAQSDLTLTYKGSNNTFTTAPAIDTIGNLALVGANNITDISGNGISFFKPTWSSVEGTATKIDAVTSAEGYYVNIKVNVAIAGSTPMNVYLGAGTGITPLGASDAEDIKAVSATRMAVLVGAAPAAPTIIYAPDGDHAVAGVETSGHRYLSAASATPKVVFGGTEDADKATYAGTVLSSFVTGATNATATAGSLVTTLAANSNVDLTFNVWLEGEDFDAKNPAISGVFNVNINIYALEA